MKLKLVTLLLAVISSVFFFGCASVGREMEMQQMQLIQRGHTTRSELVAMFGAPTSVGIQEDGKTRAIWVYSEARNTPQNFIPVVGLVAGKMETRTQQLVVVFNDYDVVESFTFNESDEPIKTGVF